MSKKINWWYLTNMVIIATIFAIIGYIGSLHWALVVLGIAMTVISLIVADFVKIIIEVIIEDSKVKKVFKEEKGA